MMELAMSEIPVINQGLPPLYNSVIPLSANSHEGMQFDRDATYAFASKQPSLPISVDEFAAAQRHFPIVFTRGETPMPAVLMSLEGQGNPYVDENGKWQTEAYVPAYVRRYPFLLIRQERGSDNFSLCVDKETSFLSEADKGNLFQDGKPTKLTSSILEFCTSYEKSIEKTRRFSQKMAELDLFTETTVRLSRGGKTLELKGFNVIAEPKLQSLDPETLASLNEKGWLGAIYAHLMSLGAFGALEDSASALDNLSGATAH